MSMIIQVDTFSDLYEEEASHVRYDINDRKDRCLPGRHTWVNANLGWANGGISVGEISSNGNTYGSVRFCSRCLHVDCFHSWDGEKTYELYYDKYYSEKRTVGFCRRCKRRIYLYGAGCCHPSAAAQKLITEVINEVYPPFPAQGVIEGGCDIKPGVYSPSQCTGMAMTLCGPATSLGSGFFVELPVIVSRILDNQGEREARDYIKACLKDGIKCPSDVLTNSRSVL